LHFANEATPKIPAAWSSAVAHDPHNTALKTLTILANISF
jgi:hypothetical protein